MQKIRQNTKFVCIMYPNVVQTKISDDNECARNVHQKSIHIQKMYKLYGTCACKLGNEKKLETYNVCLCTCKQCTNYTKPTQIVN